MSLRYKPLQHSIASDGFAAFVHCGSARKSVARLIQPIARVLGHILLMPSGKPVIISQAEPLRYGDRETPLFGRGTDICQKSV
jgi:hypothetical protein